MVDGESRIDKRFWFSLRIMMPALFLIISTIFTAYIFQFERKRAEAQIEEQSQAVLTEKANFLKSIIERAFKNSSWEVANTVAVGMGSDHSLRLILVLDSNNEILMSTFQKLIGRKFLPEDLRFDVPYAEELVSHVKSVANGEVDSTVSFKSNDYHDLARVVSFRKVDIDGVTQGSQGLLIMLYDQSYLMDRATGEVYARLRVYIIFSLLAALILSVMFNFLITRRALRIVNFMRTFYDRNNSTRCSVGGADEIAEISQGLNRMVDNLEKKQHQLEEEKRKAEAANQAKTRFLANMSHEIRTPLNAIIGVSEMLAETETTNASKTWVRVLRRASENLLIGINDILDISKIESGELTLESVDFDLKEESLAIVELFSMKAKEKGIDLILELDPSVPSGWIGDPLRIRQVISNLVSNAIKFTEQGQIRITVTASDLDSEFGRLHFQVTDTGCGISSKVMAEIFKPFVQADTSVTRRHGGSGLGLAIASHLVKLMGGILRVESEVNKGTRFFFDLKLARSGRLRKIDSQIVSTQDKNLRKLEGPCRVLVVDDSDENRLILSAYLKNQNCDIVEADSGAVALGFIRGQEFNFIFMDVSMPQMDGHTVVREIRKLEQSLDRTPSKIIMLSAHALKEQEIKAFASGADAYLTKPVRRTTVIDSMVSLTH